MINFGWTLDEYNNTDYYELLTILKAKEVDERESDPMSLL
ncbi:hypothetical protein Javan648_0013 [Streptococcus phage Javan648]|uniref:Uncharacterized protein n=1 Tax=Streptococcus urinalis 2285-97 TaxID=764291 RepID=G5KEK2_9STRE|nr:hypothetical protein STRUR_0837 [Streptococcus urinalis 2285-97]QBX22160.1 hypothetical protein Javan637_0052 [Streptococcus phage Javan637]QBX31616.1 hypothetical protein Javan642_0052 [Streptococcus phage Javan642]QBX31639.1 hypothetical protein Javan648_0013 [Streptococcus phage Javan648]